MIKPVIGTKVVYYPYMVAVISFSFEELEKKVDYDTHIPQTPAEMYEKFDLQLHAPLRANRNIPPSPVPATSIRMDAVSSAAASTMNGLDFDKGFFTASELMDADQNLIKVFVRPSYADLDLNPYDTCDTLKLKIPFQDFPFDPRTIRGAIVRYYQGSLTQAQYAEVQKGVVAKLNPYFHPPEKDLVFFGKVDDIETEWREGGASVSISARDFTAFFLETQVSPMINAAIHLTWSFPTIIAYLKRLHPAGEYIHLNLMLDDKKVANYPVSYFLSQDEFAAVKGEFSKTPRDMTIWDYIVFVCGKLSLVPYIELDALNVVHASTIWSSHSVEKREFDKHRSAKFNKRTVVIGGRKWELKNPLMILGDNIKDLSLKKSFSLRKIPTVVVRCYDPRSGVMLTARWPEKDKVEPAVPEQEEKPKKSKKPVQPTVNVIPVKEIYVSGITSIEVLREIAKTTYEQSSRQEIEGSLTTKEMSSFGGNEDDLDLLRLRPGNSIDIVAGVDALGTLSNTFKRLEGGVFSYSFLAAMNPSEVARFLRQRMMISDVERINAIMAEVQARTQLHTFRVRSIKHTMTEKGWQGRVEFMNYTLVRLNTEELLEKPVGDFPESDEVVV